ncbi:Small nuclear ribonucleoprotein E [Oopsacas minuta]|uniref:Small nuclear ribonucleoprotein E n=1 Tax=Oopsacas minuta TaxID=111878 RepID=A0AAV7KFQ1_9METZ|nr:Small nuclear ribonucleoprotein E [Oopsacas minuta]
MSTIRSQKLQKTLVQPINVIFRFLQTKQPVQVWLYGQMSMRIEGIIVGFDEFMNLVLDNALERQMKTKEIRELGRILLRGDNITLLQAVTS